MTFEELMNCYPIDGESNRKVYGELLKHAKNHNLMPFFGAGISRWAYPGWDDALKRLAKGFGCKMDVQTLLSRFEYEEAASLIAEARGRGSFSDAMVDLFRTGKMEECAGRRPAYTDLFPKIFRGPMVTTNFDRCIEYIFQKNDTPVPDVLAPQDNYQQDQIEAMLHEKKSLLLKMHGDINDPKHFVFTRESYDATYGDGLDPEKPMPHRLKRLLEGGPVLFLGCSLHADRTCAVIRACAENHKHYTLMELPKDTENKDDPAAPRIYTQQGRMKKAFSRRRDYLLNERNIQVIWYPHGMHNEALTAFFEQLARDLAIQPRKTRRAGKTAKTEAPAPAAPEKPASAGGDVCWPENPLGLAEIWLPKENDRRNVSKNEAISSSASLCLMAETGHSFLAPTQKFRSNVESLLEKGGTVHILLNDATTEHPFLSEEQKEHIAAKRKLALRGYDDLKKRFHSRIILRTISYYLPATILLTDRYGYFEPYIQIEEERQQKGFDTFELMFDKAVSKIGYDVLLHYFDLLFENGTEYKKPRRS